MREKVRRKPSPALVVALLALCVAVVGTAVAADPLGLNKRQIRKIKDVSKRQANKQITKRAPNLTVDDSAHLGAFGPDYYTTQSKAASVDGPIALTSTNQTVAQVTIPTPSQRSITGIASMEIGGTGQVSCNLRVNDADGPRLTQDVPAGSGTLALNQTENFFGGTHTVQLNCAEEALSEVTVRDIELSVIAVSTGPEI